MTVPVPEPPAYPGPPIYRSMVQPETPTPVNPQPNLAVDVEEVIAARLAEIDAKYADKIAALEAQIAARGVPVAAFTAHAAGPMHEIAETWSLAEQEYSRTTAG